MIELPEALNLAGQITKMTAGKRIASVTAEQTPHKLAWFYGDRNRYSDILEGQTVEKARAHGGLVEIEVGRANILFGDGVNVRYHDIDEKLPQKHQLLVEFEDGSALSAVVQMYGGVGAFVEGEMDNKYYLVAKEKPSPFTSSFDMEYFHSITSGAEVQKLSLKALLATEQRIPGLGNGTLQDILFNSGMHPKRKVNTIDEREEELLFEMIKGTLMVMAERGGRDTEMDLFGRPGRYRTILSKNTVERPCPKCEGLIKKEAYLGGAIYYCQKCQQL